MGQWDSTGGPISAPSAKVDKPAIEPAVAEPAAYPPEEHAQIPGALLQHERIVLGEAEHAVAAAAKQAAYFEVRVAMVDKQELVGLLAADFAPAALQRQHGVVFLQRDPICLEFALATPESILGTDFFRVDGILLLPATPLCIDLLPVGLHVNSVGGKLLCSIHRIICISFVLPFSMVTHDFPSSIPPLQTRSVLKLGRAKTRGARRRRGRAHWFCWRSARTGRRA
jgi:hypothetical protein